MQDVCRDLLGSECAIQAMPGLLRVLGLFETGAQNNWQPPAHLLYLVLDFLLPGILLCQLSSRVPPLRHTCGVQACIHEQTHATAWMAQQHTSVWFAARLVCWLACLNPPACWRARLLPPSCSLTGCCPLCPPQLYLALGLIDARLAGIHCLSKCLCLVVLGLEQQLVVLYYLGPHTCRHMCHTAQHTAQHSVRVLHCIICCSHGEVTYCCAFGHDVAALGPHLD